jgi:hypothetical protein
MNDILGPTAMGSLGGAVVGGVNDDEHWYRGAAIGAAVGAGVGRTALKAARPGNPAIYEEWLREGGAGTGFFPRSQKEAGKLLDQLRRDGVSMKDVFTPKRWWDGLQRVNQAIEEAPRLAYYKRLRAEGADVATASAKSRDVSLDFSTRGSDPLARAAGQTTAFWNPKLQGWDKMGRVLSSPKSWAIGATTMTAPSIALWNINKDNPEYWERPQYERNMFWLVPKKEGGFIRIPKPFEAGFVFASVPERLLDYSYQKDPERLKESMGDMLGNTFSGIIPLTTLGEPLIENVANFDFFRRRPVVPRSLEDLPSELQYDDRTSSVAVGAGHLTGISPKKIDNVIQDVTGSGGTMVSNAIDHAARASGLDTRDVSPSADQSQWARFATQPGVTSDAEQTFYRRWDAAEKAQRGAKALDEQGDEPALNRFLDKNADLFDDYDRLKSARKDLKDVSKKRKEVTERRDLSPAEKREMLADLADIAAEIAGEAVGGAPAKNVARR